MSQPTTPQPRSIERSASRDSSHVIHDEHPAAVSVLTPDAEGDHVIGDQNDVRTPSSRPEASSSQSLRGQSQIVIEGDVVAA